MQRNREKAEIGAKMGAKSYLIKHQERPEASPRTGILARPSSREPYSPSFSLLKTKEPSRDMKWREAQRRDKMHRLIKGKIARALPQSTVHSVCVYSAKCHTIYLFCNMYIPWEWKTLNSGTTTHKDSTFGSTWQMFSLVNPNHWRYCLSKFINYKL